MDFYNVDFEADEFFTSLLHGGRESTNVNRLKVFLGQFMTIELAYTVFRGACHLNVATSHRVPEVSTLFSSNNKLLLMYYVPPQFGSDSHAFLEVETFPPAGMSLTKYVRKWFTRGTLERVTCGEATCRQEEIKRTVFVVQNKPEIIILNLNRVIADDGQTNIRRNHDPVRLGGILKVPIDGQDVKYKLIGR